MHSATDISDSEDGSFIPTGKRRSERQPQAAGFLRAAADGDLDQVIRILEGGADINGLRVRGATALHEAAKAGQMAVVMELLRRSAQINSVNRNGCTALHFAALCKDREVAAEVIDQLLDAGALVNATNQRLDTPLHFAAHHTSVRGTAGVLQRLIGRGAMVNARNRNSESPLFSATLNHNLEAVQVLIKSGADVGQRNSQEKSVEDIAVERNLTEVLEAIETMKDPASQLADATQQMRTALSQMRSVDMLANDLKRQSALSDAYESIAVAAVAELSPTLRTHLVEHSIATLGNARSEGATQQQVLQALAYLLIISRSRGGSDLLGELGVLEVLPVADQVVTRYQVGQKELRELKLLLGKPQMGLEDLSTRFSTSSTLATVSGPLTPGRESSPTNQRTLGSSGLGTVSRLLVPKNFSTSDSEVRASPVDPELLPATLPRQPSRTSSISSRSRRFSCSTSVQEHSPCGSASLRTVGLNQAAMLPDRESPFWLHRGSGAGHSASFTQASSLAGSLSIVPREDLEAEDKERAMDLEPKAIAKPPRSASEPFWRFKADRVAPFAPDDAADEKRPSAKVSPRPRRCAGACSKSRACAVS